MEEGLFLKSFKNKLQLIKEGFASEMNKLQTGRAHPSILDGVFVEVYETKLPLTQVASIISREATVLAVTPFDSTNIAAISKAIAGNERLGLNPTDDGRAVYVQIPPLTTERRQAIVKTLHGLKEDYMVRLRHARHHSLKSIKEDSDSQEVIGHLEKEIEKIVSEAKQLIEANSLKREKEILGMTA